MRPHGNQGKEYDPPLSPGARAYLAAFDRYLAATKSEGDTTAARDAREDMRDRCAEMVDVALGRRIRVPYAVCECGNTFELPTTRGRPPKRCESCRQGTRRFRREAA